MIAFMTSFAGPKPIPVSALDLVRTCCHALHLLDINTTDKIPEFNNTYLKIKE